MYSLHKNSLYFILMNLSIEKKKILQQDIKIMIYADFEASPLLFMCSGLFILPFTPRYKNGPLSAMSSSEPQVGRSGLKSGLESWQRP